MAEAELLKFWQVVEQEFDRYVEEAGAEADDSAMRDKRRIREKIRKAAQSAALEDEGRKANIIEAVTALVEDALERLWQAPAAWLLELNWPRIFEAFVVERWPRLQPKWLVRPALDEVVTAWMQSAARPPPADAGGPRPGDAPPGRVVEHVFPGTTVGATLSGCVVKALREGSIGASMLNVGDEILAVNDRAVSSSDEIAGALKAAPPRPVRLRVRVSGAVAPAPGAPGGPVRSTDWLPAGMRATLDGLSAPDADSLLWVHPKPPAEEAGNREIVINGEDIGHEAAKCDAFACHEFPWRAVQVAIEHFEKQGYSTQTVVSIKTVVKWPPPKDISRRLVECPVIDPKQGVPSACTSDRIFAVRIAETYGCQFVDNFNYRPISWGTHPSWPWLQEKGLRLRVPYMFDKSGHFTPLLR